jgi:ABC-2 type transport system permease protein
MNIRRVHANLVMGLKEFYRNKATMFFVLLFPILLMVLFGYIFSGQGDVVYNLPVQNLDDGPLSTNLTTTLGMTGLFEIIDVPESADPRDYLVDEKENTVLVIPAGYSSNIMSGNQTTLTVYYDPSNTAALTKTQILSSIIDGMNKYMANVTDIIEIQGESAVSDEFEYIEFFVPGIIAMSVMTTSLFGTVGMNTELRQKGVLRKLATTPLTRSEWLLSNILYQFVMAMMSTTLIILVGALVFDLRPHIGPFMLIFIVLNVFAFAGIGMLITRFVKDAEAAQAAANAVMFPMMFLSGTFFPLEQMPDFLQGIAKFLPLYYVNEGLRASMITQDMGIIVESFAVIVVVAVVIFILGVFITSWKED